MDPEFCYVELCELYSYKIAKRVLTDYFKQKPSTTEECKKFIEEHFEFKIIEIFELWYNTHFLTQKKGNWKIIQDKNRCKFRELFNFKER